MNGSPPLNTDITTPRPEEAGAELGREEKERRAKHFFLTLARRAEANPDAAKTLSKVLGDRIAVYWEPALEAALEAAEALGYAQVHPVIDAAIARSLRDKPDLRLVGDLYNRIPLDTVLLKQTGLEVFRQTVRAMEARNRVELHPVEYLTMWLNFVQRLVQSHLMDEAEMEAQAALEFARERFAQSPEKFLDGLVSSLETCAIISNEAGQYSASRALREEEIRLLRGVSGHEKAFAQCLSNHAGVLKSLGDFSAALSHSLEAVQLYRTITAKNVGTATDYSHGLQAYTDDPRPILGLALIALSTYQNDAKQFQECLGSVQEAFVIFHELSEQFPDQFRHSFAMARHNLGMAKFGVGDKPGGLQEMRESAAIYEHLANVHPEIYSPEHAHILWSLGLAYVKNDRNAEALETVEKCAALYRTLNQSAGNFTNPLAATLTNLRILHEAAGHADQVERISSELAQLIVQDMDVKP